MQLRTRQVGMEKAFSEAAVKFEKYVNAKKSWPRQASADPEEKRWAIWWKNALKERSVSREPTLKQLNELGARIRSLKKEDKFRLQIAKLKTYVLEKKSWPLRTSTVPEEKKLARWWNNAQRQERRTASSEPLLAELKNMEQALATSDQ